MHHTYIHQGQGSYINGCFRIKAQDHRYVHHSHMHHIYHISHIYQDICILDASYIPVSGSRVMDKCIIGMYIMVTCIRIKNIRIAHAYIHQVQESYMHACFRIKVQYQRYMHLHTCIRVKVQYHRYINHTHMHLSQGSRKVDKCIIHACIRIKGHGKMHNRYVHHGHMCQGQESMHRTCIQTSRSRMIHTLMHQSQGPGS